MLSNLSEKRYKLVEIITQDLNHDRSEALKLVSDLLVEALLKVNTYGVSLEITNKELEKKCVSLEATIQELEGKLSIKTQPDCVNKNDESFFVDNDGSSPRTSPNDLNSNQDLSQFIHSLSSSDRQEDNEVENTLKTPVGQTSNRETSPVVQKQSRSGKRKLRLSSNKRYRMEDHSKVDPNHFTEIPEEFAFLNRSPELKKDLTFESNGNLSPKPKKDLKDCIPPLAESNLSEDDSSIVEPSPAPVSKNRRINSIFSNKKISSIENVNNNVLSPLSVNLLSDREKQAANPVEKNDDQKNDTPKSKWELKKAREVSANGNKKLRQTTLSTTFFTKSVDISTLNEFKGGVASETACKTDPVDMELTIMNATQIQKDDIQIQKENRPIQPYISSQETFYHPGTPSKDTEKSAEFNEPDTGFPEDYFRVDPTSENIAIGTEFQETFFDPQISSTMKQDNKLPVVEQSVVKNSFDYLPSPKTSPNYKYRRDPLRKKADRQKLPGQKCIHCFDFYGPCAGGCGSGDQLARKFSRHRDKFELRSYTPPGLWNPRFDDTDGSD